LNERAGPAWRWERKTLGLGAKEEKASRAGPDTGVERGLQAPVRLFFERASRAGPGGGSDITAQQGRTTATEQPGFKSFLPSYIYGSIYELKLLASTYDVFFRFVNQRGYWIV